MSQNFLITSNDCEHCKGKGNFPGKHGLTLNCQKCHGHGWIETWTPLEEFEADIRRLTVKVNELLKELNLPEIERRL